MELSEVIEAYFDCRHNKRNTANQLRFEMDYEHECISLWEDINNRTYEPGRSIAFVVEHPVKREIFAADFRDRVVHHIIARRIYPLLERQFILDSYSTQKGKGTLFGINRVEQHIRDCSQCYTRDCYILKCDIQGFFMSISKERLYDTVMCFLRGKYEGEDLQLLEYLLCKTIYNRPELNCILKMPRRRWNGLPQNKSLFGTDGTHGLPIGNLTSQLLALLFLDELDHRIRDEWGVRHYGRYVDDMVLIHPSKQKLMDVYRKMCQWLSEHGLRMHPRKFYLQHYAKGVMFVGGMVKPGRKYISHRTIGRMFAQINHYNMLLTGCRKLTGRQTDAMVATMNSYLGMMCHYRSQRLFRRMLGRVSAEWYRYVYFSRRADRTKMVVRKKAAIP